MVGDSVAQLFARLAAVPLVEVAGVVDPSGVAVAKLRGGDDWMLVFELPRWRIGRGEIKRIPLSVKRRVPAAEKDVWPALLRPCDILRFRARVLDDDGFSRALLDGFYGQDASDPDLRWHAESLRRPPTHLDSVLGTVTHDPRRDWYAVKANWNGTPMVLRVPADNDRSLDEALRTAPVLWQEQAVWNARILGSRGCQPSSAQE